jgi:hypothetical protein
MARRVSRWQIAALIFGVINAGGAVFALARGETTHALTHVGLLLGTFAFWQVISPSPQAYKETVPNPIDSQVERLQQSVDAIALEVERIGEGQRFINKLQQEQSEREPLKRNPTSGSESSGAD